MSQQNRSCHRRRQKAGPRHRPGSGGRGLEYGAPLSRLGREAETAAGEVRAQGVKAATLQGRSVARRRDRAADRPRRRPRLGPLTALINSASLFENDDWQSGQPRQAGTRIWKPICARPFLLSQTFRPASCPKAKGAIVNIIDQRVLKPTPQFISYSLSKAGLYWLTTTLAQALGPNIRVNAVGPGPTMRNARQSEADFARQRDATILKHGAEPEDVAARGALSAGGRGRHRPDAGGGWRPASDLADPRCAGGRMSKTADPTSLPSATSGIRHVFIRNLELPAQIGVYRQEEGRTQPVRINVDLAVEDLDRPGDMLAKVVDYRVIEKRIRAIIAEGHVRLAETLAERIAGRLFRGCAGPHRAGAGGEAACPDQRRKRGGRN